MMCKSNVAKPMLTDLGNPLRVYIRRFVHQESDVDDIYQDTYIKLMEVQQVSNIENIHGYARKVAKNLIIDKAKQAFSKCEEIVEEPVCNKSELGEIMDQQERIHIYQGIIQSMPAIRRQVFFSYRLKGDSKEEIAQRMGLSSEAVNKHITRALSMLKEHMAKVLDEKRTR